MKFTKTLLAMTLFLSASLVLTGCDDDDDDNPIPTGGGNDATVVDALVADDNYSSLVAAVQKAGLVNTLADGAANYTVFAPDNAAFAALLTAIGAGSLDDVSVEQLTPILLYHVMNVRVESGDAVAAAQNGDTITTLGGTAQLAFEAGAIRIDDLANVEDADLALTDNGVVHGIDAVILPSIADVATTSADFSNLVAALGVADQATENNADLVATLDDNSQSLTVFAPVDAAFGDLVTALSGNASIGISGLGDFAPHQLIPVLKYHVAAGMVTSSMITDGDITTLGGTPTVSTTGGVSIDGANVVTADIFTRNGVIHVIDAVILPSITDIVVNAPEMAQLAATVLTADADQSSNPAVAPVLDGAGEAGYTLFAPSNAAFTNLGSAPSGQALTNVLLYHALSGAVYAADALALSNASVPTALGATAASSLTVNGGSSVTIQDAGSETVAAVEVVNYLGRNGVIHIVDKVLLPGAE